MSMRFVLLLLLCVPSVSSAAVTGRFDKPTGDVYLSITDADADVLITAIKAKNKTYSMIYENDEVMKLGCSPTTPAVCDMVIFNKGRLANINPRHRYAELAAYDHDWLSRFVLPKFNLKPFATISTSKKRSTVLISTDNKLKIWVDLTQIDSRTQYYSFYLLFDDPA